MRSLLQPSRRAATAGEALIERIIQQHLRPGVVNLAPGTAHWLPPAEVMPVPTADDSRYGACHGSSSLLTALRTKLEDENGIDMSDREVMVTNGANQAYVSALLALCDPGDEVVLFAP